MEAEEGARAANRSHEFWAKTAIFIVLACWVITAVVGFFLPGDQRGTFGDQFGAVNALFSGLALAGLVYGILQQQAALKMARAELNLAREDARKTKKMLDEQTKALDEQNQANRRQAFETHFFELLKTHREIREDLRHSNSSGKKIFASVIIDFTNNRNSKTRAGVDNTIENIYLFNQSILSTYIWQLGSVYEFLDSADYVNMGYSDKMHGVAKYQSILHTQMEEEEHIVWYVCLKNEKLKKLRKYQIVSDGPRFASIKQIAINRLGKEFADSLDLPDLANQSEPA
ncbi:MULTISPECIES: hypothetical protein [unclassified Pseudovibrio]|uniref:hypothetical protein n=1 Tax=unclassified Pseudovibrio TaxID=2627060 RepID=UPI0007AE9354|nr:MULTISPECIES: hypothetical protein [unclassified Pseudovibrio]KZL00521.1 hypothetical protein PsW74_02947 [Pseudovibrio sp. W74]KZL07696.1 hypothetical protein PsAD14_04086 [Pseudovibrio sp. Ad14]